MPDNIQTLQNRVARMEAQAGEARLARITNSVDTMIHEGRIPEWERSDSIMRAMTDDSYLAVCANRPPAPTNGLSVIGEDGFQVLQGIRQHIVTGPASIGNAAIRGAAISRIWRKERDRILPVMNAAANTIDSALKRVAILQETVRAFATRVLPLKAFATAFANVPLQGTDEVVVAYYPLQATASSDFVEATGYVFDQATSTQKAKITVNKRKYQPIDYSSTEFCRQPWLNTVLLGNINAEKLGVDVLNDVLSVITAAKFGAAVKNVPVGAITSDDVIDIKGQCTNANWPDLGRSLIVDSTVETSLQKDEAYKLALNIGGTEVIRGGKLPQISGFEFHSVPNFPTNAENLIGIAAFQSAIGAAFSPVEPAQGVRAQLVAYEIATDEATGISFNYRHWGVAQADRDYEVIECAYGYEALVAAALKRITKP